MAETAGTTTLSREQRYQETRRVTVVGGIIDLLLGVVKIIVGEFAHSQALIADGVHSLSDLATDVMVIWAAKHASREPDALHPYGHQRIETVTSIVLGVVLTVVAVGLAWDAVNTMLERETPLIAGPAALFVAALSVGLKEAIYHYTMRAAQRLQSDMLRSNAWHSRTDALSSVVVIVGVGGTMLGFSYLDALAAVTVAIMIIWVGGKMVWSGIQELIDTGAEPEIVRAMNSTVCEVDGVLDVHELRTRRMGGDLFLDGHVLVAPHLSVSEGHRIGEEVRNRLKSKFDTLTDITLHVDAEDDAAYQKSAHLPLRRDLKQELDRRWSRLPEAGHVERLVLHYLDGSLRLEVWLPLAEFASIDAAREAGERLRAAVAGHPQIGEVKTLFH
jgi:cation diffusion facilitator family transporter